MRRARRTPSPERRLATWRAVILTSAVASLVASLLAAKSYREGDAVAGGLFTLAMIGLLALMAVAVRRARARA